MATALLSGMTRLESRNMGLIILGHALTHWYPATFYMLLPLIGSEMGLSYSQIGFIMTCQYAAGAISNVPGGMLVDVWGKKGQLMALSLFWVGFPYLLMGFTTEYWMLLLCVMLVGIGNNLWHPTAIPLLGRMFPERKGFVLSLHGMGGNVGDALAPLVVGVLLTTLSWREIVLLNVVPGAAMSVLLLFFLGALTFAPKAKASPSDADHSKNQPATNQPAIVNGGGQSMTSYMEGLRTLMRTRGLFMLTLSSSFRSMTQGTLLTFLPLYLAKDMKYDIFWVGVILAILQLAGFIAAPIAGHLSDTMGRKTILVSCFGVSGVVLLLMTFAGATPLFVFLIAVLGFFLYAARPIMQAWMLEATPKNMGGTAIGLMFGMQSGAQAIAPVLGGIVADQYGLLSAFYLLAATIILANIMVIWIPSSDTVEAKK
ncbi:MFS transporter [Limnohabitans sp. Rim8]|uniref:MFS transporter n=1 Tax=Limnohabitans sp. Rim8 TaxID=1100718 RepID=UPI0025E7B14D|nr:MFS transporter [Limnohabitans sp. Rim8]